MCLKSNTIKSQLLLLLCLKIYMILAASNPPQSRPMKQCGLPPNLEELPDFAQDEIRAVWKDYVAGRKCDKEMLITEDILAVLAMFDKELERQGMKMSRGERGKGLDRIGLVGIGTPELDTLGTSTRAPEAVQTVLVRRGGEEAAEEEEERSTVKEVERHSTMTSTSLSTSTPLPTPSLPPTSSTDAPAPPPTPFGPPTLPKEPRQIMAAAATVETSYQTNPREQPPIGRPGKVPQQAELAETGENEEAEGAVDDNQEVIRPIKQKIMHEYEDRAEPEEPAEEKEPVQQLFEPASQLPFLRGAKTAVVNVFRQVLEDPRIASETRRMEEIHVLAVSYLNARQLVKFNAWSSERRKKIHLREHQLSRPGREALERLARATDERQRRLELRTMPAELRGELHGFAMDKRRREKSGNGIGTEKKQ